MVIAAYLAVALGSGLLLARRSGGSMENFFLSGRRLPWWLAGTSMVATTFAADTPLVVTGWTRDGGVAQNWRWWSYLIGNLLVVVVYSRLWRRSRVITDVELMQLRYSGRSAAALRSFKAVYQMVFLHAFVIGWVILAMQKVFTVLLGADAAWPATIGCIVVALVYSEVSGLWGVVATDFVQFLFAMVGAIVLAVGVADHFGGLGPMLDAVRAAPDAAAKTSLVPDFARVTWSEPSTWPTETLRFLIFVGVLWFATKNADGSGVMVQRILASKDERHALGGTLWYTVAHNAIRPWPWILVALASLAVLPPVAVPSPVDGVVAEAGADAVVVHGDDGRPRTLRAPPGDDRWAAAPVVAPGERVVAGQSVLATDPESAYPEMMRRFLPAGLLGLLVASFLAAFMSTVDTHVNVASSYLVNDLYRRHVRADAPPSHYVRVARLAGPFVALLGIGFASGSSSARGMFDAFTALFGGVGVVYLLRWLWWRVNAWSEVAGLATSAAVVLALRLRPDLGARLLPPQLVADGAPAFEGTLLLVTSLSFVAALVATWLTRPTDPTQLDAFYARVRPPGAWGPVRARVGGAAERPAFWARAVLAWAAAVVFVVGCVVAPGEWLMGRADVALRWGLAGAAGGLVMWIALPALPAPSAPAGEAPPD